ncbi:MAG: Mrp/NBP35 family ATP-binding protein [Chlorobi bacterium]|nr:Mrp/NBP35 family ATP-binding protein [Chlorobiota bacterium]
MELTRDNVLEVLRGVKHPEKNSDLVSLQMVDNLRIDGKQVLFTLSLPKANDPFTGSIKKACENQIKNNFGEDIKILITVPVSVGKVKIDKPGILPGVKNIIVVASGKGGVGKSTVATNLAVALANSGFQTALVDADIFGPSIPKMLHLEEMKPQVHKVDGRDMIIPVENYNLKILSIGFFVDPDDALIWRGPMATNALKQLLHQGDWGELDFMVVDLPPGTSDIHLTMVQEIPVTGAIIVSTPQDVALADAVKGISMFRSEKINVPILGLVENMAWFTPEELPDKKYYIFGKGGCEKLANQYKIPLLSQIPIIQKIRESGDLGKPPAADKNTILGGIFRDLAAKVVEQLEKRNKELPPTQRLIIKN